MIVLSLAGAVLWIEHGHRIDLATSTGEAFAAPVATVCPDSENVPWTASRSCSAVPPSTWAGRCGRR